MTSAATEQHAMEASATKCTTPRGAGQLVLGHRGRCRVWPDRHGPQTRFPGRGCPAPVPGTMTSMSVRPRRPQRCWSGGEGHGRSTVGDTDGRRLGARLGRLARIGRGDGRGVGPGGRRGARDGARRLDGETRREPGGGHRVGGGPSADGDRLVEVRGADRAAGGATRDAPGWTRRRRRRWPSPTSRRP